MTSAITQPDISVATAPILIPKSIVNGWYLTTGGSLGLPVLTKNAEPAVAASIGIGSKTIKLVIAQKTRFGAKPVFTGSIRCDLGKHIKIDDANGFLREKGVTQAIGLVE